MRLLVATHNQGKVRELNQLLGAAGFDCVSLDDAGIAFDVEETGTTFLANATLKATQYGSASGLLTLADDSGLEIDALGGAPGVYSARYGGSGLTQPQRNQLVLDQLQGVAERSARFRCAVVLADGNGQVLATADGVCEGEIGLTPAGTGGFGYDPLLFLPSHGCTMAELAAAEKNKISHRARAIQAILPAVLAHTGG